MQVFRKRANPYHLPVPDVTFMPGTNFVPADKEDAVRKNPHFQEQCEIGNMKIVDDSPSTTESKVPEEKRIAAEVAGLNATKAKDAIEEIGSIPALKLIEEEDSRTSVRTAATKRLEVLMEVPDEDEDEDE